MEAENRLVDAAELRRMHVEPVEVTVKDERLAAAVGLIGLKKRIQCQRVAVQPARDPQRFYAQRKACGDTGRRVAVAEGASPARPGEHVHPILVGSGAPRLQEGLERGLRFGLRSR